MHILMTNLPPQSSSFTCDRHPEDNLTVAGFCPSCLHERLTILDQSSSKSNVMHSLDDENKNKPLRNANNYEIRVSEDEEVENLNDLENDIVEMEAKIDTIVANLKSIKHQIDQDSHSKKPSFSNFWLGWNKKLQNWRRKQKKNVLDKKDITTLPTVKSVSRETQSEIGDYGYGRRSCDTGPRFSLDAGRVSVDDRGSWDGYVIGRSFPKLPPMNVARSDKRIPMVEGEPGGSTQTREYYLNSCSKRRKGQGLTLERSNSIQTVTAKVSPTTSIDYRGRVKWHSIGGEKELDFNSNSNSNSNSIRIMKKEKWWNWKVWGLNNRQTATHKRMHW